MQSRGNRLKLGPELQFSEVTFWFLRLEGVHDSENVNTVAIIIQEQIAKSFAKNVWKVEFSGFSPILSLVPP